MRARTWLLAVALAGCEPGELPGESLGRYAIVGTLLENTCGSTALPARDPLEFQVELRAIGGVGTWIVDEPPGFNGTLQPGGRFRFTRESRYVAIPPGASGPEPPEVADFLAADVAATGAPNATQTPGCTLAIRETVAGTAHRTGAMDAGRPLDAGAQPDLQADNTIEIAPLSGSDCTATLAFAGGPFLELPCHAKYALEGELN